MGIAGAAIAGLSSAVVHAEQPQPAPITAKPATPTPSIVDLFKALPKGALSTELTNQSRNDRAFVLGTNGLTAHQAIEKNLELLAEIDVERGFMFVRSLGDGAGWYEHFKTYPLPGGATILINSSTQWGMCGDQSEVRVWRFDDLHAQNVTEDRWPTPTWTNFNNGTPTTEQHNRAPVYGVNITKDGQMTVTLDGCQLDYPPTEPLVFTPANPEFPLDPLNVTWDKERFRIHRPAPAKPTPAKSTP